MNRRSFLQSLLGAVSAAFAAPPKALPGPTAQVDWDIEGLIEQNHNTLNAFYDLWPEARQIRIDMDKVRSFERRLCKSSFKGLGRSRFPDDILRQSLIDLLPEGAELSDLARKPFKVL